MRTARLLTVSQHVLHRGGVPEIGGVIRGVPAEGDCLRGACGLCVADPLCEQNDRQV